MADDALIIEDAAALTRYLRATGRIGAHEQPAIAVLRGGVSNRTVLVEHADGRAWVLKQALPKLRVDADWFSDPSRIEREAAGIRALETLLPPGSVPALVFEDRTHHLLAMQAVASPHENWKRRLLAGYIEDERVDRFGRLLALLHGGARARREELQPIFADRSFFESLRLEPYYTYTAAQVPEAAAFLQHLMDETRGIAETLVHGDYSPKNILISDDPERFVLLDHEVIHWGDAAFDSGFALTHLLSKAHHLREHRERFAASPVAFWRAYAEAPVEPALEERVVRHTLACLLARVAGRSPLEYLAPDERLRQRAVVLALLARMPATVAALAAAFCQQLSERE